VPRRRALRTYAGDRDGANREDQRNHGHVPCRPFLAST
jgi:hypothetical protein